MTDTLRDAVALVERLSPEQQDAIAEVMLREVEEREWDVLVSGDASQRFLLHLAAEARAEDARGQTHDASDGW